jgi:hypothetical protein
LDRRLGILSDPIGTEFIFFWLRAMSHATFCSHSFFGPYAAAISPSPFRALLTLRGGRPPKEFP